MFEKQNPQQLLANMQHCYAENLAAYEDVRKGVSSNLQTLSLLSKAVLNCQATEESRDTLMEEINLVFARNQFIELYRYFACQLVKEGIDMDEHGGEMFDALLGFIASTPQVELSYMCNEGFDCALVDMVGMSHLVAGVGV